MLTSMTCGRAQKLMPLYAAGDLAGWRGRRVAAHVRGCGPCRRLAAEFAATRGWARAASEPPEFGAEFYEGLRQSVLEEIRRDRRPAGSRRSPLFAAAGGRQLAYAASFALALVACALAIHFHLRRSPDAPQLPLAAATPTNVNEVPRPATTPVREAQEPPPAAPRSVERHKPQPRAQVAAGNPRRTLTLRGRAKPDAAVRGLTAGAQPEREPHRSAAGAAMPSKPGEVARIEIQTADPNIRIIWLAPQEADAPAPNR
ncbi:MAG: zf-HC2 domain-containing protein [Acidobacteria bacterium]|nr:zf-HC2 domain-containing protein [Acidobacteriota bacterium]